MNTSLKRITVRHYAERVQVSFPDRALTSAEEQALGILAKRLSETISREIANEPGAFAYPGLFGR